MRYFSRCSLGMSPVRDTGWKLTALTMSLFLCAYLTIAPSSWSFTPLITVGTRTTPMPAALHASST
jgi:hypothetical protein